MVVVVLHKQGCTSLAMGRCSSAAGWRRIRCHTKVASLPGPPPQEAPAEQLCEELAFSPEEMKTIGDRKVAPMGFGTWAWGNQLLWGYDPGMDQELQKMFNLLVSRGINLFDTADSYGTGKLNGRSEQLLGRFIREYPGLDDVREGVLVATKLAAYPWRVTPANMVAACRGSLRRLEMPQVALGQLHWSAAKYAPLQEWALWNGLADCYEKGLVAAVGVSNYGPRELAKVHRKFARRNVPLVSAQVQFSLLSFGPDQRLLLEVCEDLGIQVIAYSPLALGILAGQYSNKILPPGPRSLLFRQLLPQVQPLIEAVQAVAEERKKTPSQVAINWCMRKGTVPIPGGKSLKQVQENLGALGWKLSEAEVAELEAVAASLKAGMVQNIFSTK